MDVDFAILADAAEVSNGKLYVLGGAIDTIWGASAPCVHPQISFALKLLLEPAELQREHELEVCVVEADGKRVMSMKGKLESQRSANLPSGWKQGVVAVMKFVNLKFPHFGHYEFAVLVNGSQRKSVPFRVEQRVPVQQG